MSRSARSRVGLLLVILLTISPANFGTAQESGTDESSTHIVFLAGKPSHGYGAHEHLAGCRILANAIEAATEDVECTVIGGGWPEDESVLKDADSIVMYCDGGRRHPALNHLEQLQSQMDRKCGFVCIHYAVEVPMDQGGKEFLEWLGGYFETNWSVNPHWVAKFSDLPDHPITRGVTPFATDDEWYFHMRFRQGMDGVTPILSAVPPAHTMRRKDGPHSGNPAVRKAVAEGVPQHTAWAYERSNGGRSFGFTGGHYHWNWGRPEVLKLVCNGILWSAQQEISAIGIAPPVPKLSELENGQDEPQPEKFDPNKIRTKFELATE
jgi:type 1 glutamine amidotransferase